MSRTAILYDNHGERREYWVGLRVGDRLRARGTVWSKGDGPDLRSVYDYEAFRAGEVYKVHEVLLWGGFDRVGFVMDGDSTCHMATTDLFEPVEA